jgi:hypothetical protein
MAKINFLMKDFPTTKEYFRIVNERLLEGKIFYHEDNVIEYVYLIISLIIKE